MGGVGADRNKNKLKKMQGALEQCLWGVGADSVGTPSVFAGVCVRVCVCLCLCLCLYLWLWLWLWLCLLLCP